VVKKKTQKGVGKHLGKKEPWENEPTAVHLGKKPQKTLPQHSGIRARCPYSEVPGLSEGKGDGLMGGKPS